MKNCLKRLTAMVAVLCTCAGLVFSAAAIPSPDELADAVTPIDLTATATELSSGDYLVQYQASLTMSEPFAKAVASMNTGDYLQNLKFTCILDDALVEKLAPTNVAITFSGPGAEYFSLDSTEMKDGALNIHYKLDPADIADWKYNTPDQRDELVQDLMQEMTMSSESKTVTAAELAQAKDGSGRILTDARVEITYDGGVIPIYDAEMILAAQVEQVPMQIYGYSSGSGKPNHKIEVDKQQDTEMGSIKPSVSSSPNDKVVTITVDADEGYRLTGLVITDKNGNRISVTRNDVDTFSFTMPNSAVTVTPTFDLSATRPEDSGAGDKLITKDHIPFMVGDDKGNFRPNASITRAEVAQIFYALLKDKNVPITVSFDDVDGDAWYAKAVNTLASLGAVKGVGGGKFAPERNITRAEFATIAANFAKLAGNPFDFRDVSDSHWAYPYISTAAAYGWVAGVGGNNFEPDRGIMRAEAATIVNNMLGRIGDKETIDAGLGRSFPDVDKSHWGWYEIGEASSSHDHDFNDTFTSEFWAD